MSALRPWDSLCPLAPRSRLSSRRQPAELPSIRTTLPAPSRARAAPKPASGSLPRPTDAHQVPEDRGHRRPGALSTAGPPGEGDFTIWTRGYGLVDSRESGRRPAGSSRSGRRRARCPERCTHLSRELLVLAHQHPPESQFPGTGPSGNGIGPQMLTQHHWISQIKVNCNVCHQLGNQATREIPTALGTFARSLDAWDRRVQAGQDGAGMSQAVNVLGRTRGLQMYADWTDRIAAGEVPPAPPRPQGLERNLVLTMWDWGGPATFAHDELTTDKRNPTANAYGPIYGVDWGNDGFLTIDPLEHTATERRIPVLDPKVPPGKAQSMPVPSPYWGNKLYWYDPAITNHAAMDSKGRVWMSSRFRLPENQPAFCATHPSAALAPQPQSFRQIQYFDPKTRDSSRWTSASTSTTCSLRRTPTKRCTETAPSVAPSAGCDTRVLDQTGDVGAAQGWCRLVVRTSRSRRQDRSSKWIGRLRRRFDRRIFYSVIPHPTDGSVWGAVISPMPGRIVRLDPKTCVGEAYEPPFDSASGMAAYSPRGIDVDSNGVIWTALAGSGHLASFDRRKCKVLSGAAAVDGQHCREGWTLHPVPGPRFKNVRGDIPATFSTTTSWTVTTRSASAPTCRWRTAPRPIRSSCCDRTEVGWCCACRIRSGSSRAAWTAASTIPRRGGRAVASTPTMDRTRCGMSKAGSGTRGAVVKFQLRPDPLAK